MATPFVLTATIQTQLHTGSVQSTLAHLRKTLGGKPIPVRVIVDTKPLEKAEVTLRRVKNEARGASGGMADFGRLAGMAGKRFLAFTVASAIFIKLTMAIREGVGQAIEFDREMVRLSQVTGKSVKALRDIERSVTDLSMSMGVASKSIMSITRILAQTGMTAKDTKIAMKVLAQTELAPTFTNIEKTAEGAIAAMRQFKIAAEDLHQVLGAINAVSKRFAVESDDLIAAVRRTGGVFASAGGSVNELIALFTSVRATTRETAETIATGLRTIFTRIQRPRTIKFLRQFGVELTDLQGNFVGPMEAVRRLSVALHGLSTTDFRFAAIVEQLGGFRQVGKVIPMITEFKTATAAYAVAQAGANSLTDDATKAQQALNVQITKVKEEFHAMMRKMVASEGFKTMFKMAMNLASALIKLTEALEPILPMLMTLATLKIATGMGGFMRGAAAGAAPMAAARGGVVPGTGNRDTVPAVLTPGEFVIRKSAAKKLGYDQLGAMNKHGKGGIIEATGKYGGLFLSPQPSNDSYKNPREHKGSLIKGGSILANKVNLAMGKRMSDEPLVGATKGRGDAARLDFNIKGTDRQAFIRQLEARQLEGKLSTTQLQGLGMKPGTADPWRDVSFTKSKLAKAGLGSAALGPMMMASGFTNVVKPGQGGAGTMIDPTDIGMPGSDMGVALRGTPATFGIGADAEMELSLIHI